MQRQKYAKAEHRYTTRLEAPRIWRARVRDKAAPRRACVCDDAECDSQPKGQKHIIFGCVKTRRLHVTIPTMVTATWSDQKTDNKSKAWRYKKRVSKEHKGKHDPQRMP